MALNLEGRTLGKYRVMEALGRGGMARVYRAYHPRLDRYVAIKVLRSDLVEDEEFLTRFQREAQAVAGLRHPNIVQVFDFDVQDDVYYMVMELLEGDTLKSRLNDYRTRGEQMAAGEIVRILLDVLDGLAYAHSEGMFHRDIKPANVLLTKRGQAVVADFGIAHIVGGTQHTVTGALMGTLNYMAPEQGLEGRNDTRSDIYSLGIVFYEMLTQRPPFEADTPLAVLMKHVNDPLPLPRKIDPTIPESLERVVLKALAKDPDDRYQSAQEMAQALRQAAEEAEVELPERISLPLSFATAEAPSESVAVLSGTARAKIADADFAADETDPTLGEKLAAEAGRARKREARERARAEKRSERGRGCGGVGGAILNAAVLLVVVNLIIVWVSMVLNNWAIYARGWPLQLCLVSVGLCLVMHATESIYWLIPIGLVLGTAFLMVYPALTDHWEIWVFIWPLPPLLGVGTIWLTNWLAQRGEDSRQVSRVLAQALGGTSVVLGIVVFFVALIAS